MNNDKKNIIAPKYFVGLHAHSTFSIGDAIGRPQEHMEFAISNEMDALALTDHGNMNGFSHQYLHGEALKKKGIDFKPIYGCEAYFVPSLTDWTKLYEENKAKKAQEKYEAKMKKMQEEIDTFLLNPEEDEEVETEDSDTKGDAGVENEEESKSTSWKNPLYQRNHLVLLAKNNEGLKSLFKIISLSFKDGFYKYPRIDFDLLRKYSNGNIIASSACLAGYPGKIIFDNQENFINFRDDDGNIPITTNVEKIQNELKNMVEKFQDILGPENFYLELQFNKLNAQHLLNYHLLECSKRTKTPLVVTCDSHYSNPNYWREREIYKAMSQMQMLKKSPDEIAKSLPQKIDDLKCELYPKNAQQVWDTYTETTKQYNFYCDEVVRDAIQRTHTIAHDQISSIEMDKKIKLPIINKIVDKSKLELLLKENKDLANNELQDEDQLAFQQLKKDVIAGAKLRKIDNKEEYIERLKYELSVIKHLKFSKYFLTYAKIMEIIDQHMLVGNARGSAGGSLVSYVLNITQLDPIKHELLFARFLGMKKKGYPDIDSDFSDREKALELITEYFGKENIVPVSNFNQLQLKSLIKDVAKLQGISFEEINQYTKKIDLEALAEAKKEPGFDMQQWELTYEEAENHSLSFRELMTKYPELSKTIQILFKQLKAVSRHAGGIIITNNAIDNMPVIKSGGVLQTPWQEGINYRHLEGFGFLKFDILGIGTLRMFENCIRRILKKKYNKKHISFEEIKDFFYKEMHPDNNPMDDMNVYKNVYWNKNYAGIFQFVQKNVQDFMEKLKPVSVLDIAVTTSIFRPGPLGLGADKLYLKNRQDLKSIKYKHPLLKEVLEPTCGLIIFQEQLQLIYHKLAGVPLDDTDDLRKALLKKDKSNKEKTEKELKRLKQDFIDRCFEANNISNELAEEIFDEMMLFVSYSFNKSHAVAYAITSYQCAYLLTYYPDEWIASYIDYCALEKGKATNKEDPKVVALAEAKSLGYKIGKPDINESTMEILINNRSIIPSFGTLKSIGSTAYSEILQHRPYTSVEDLLWNNNETWRHSKLNKKSLSNLIKLEAFDSMGIVGENTIFKNYKQMHYVLIDNGDLLKRAIMKKNKNHKEVLERLIQESSTIEDWSINEKIKFNKELGGSVDNDMIVTPEIREYFNKVKIKSIDDWSNEKELYWAIVKASKEAKTRTGKIYCRVSLTGDSGQMYNCFFWSYNPNKDKLIPENMLIIGNFKKTDFGLSSFYSKIEVLEKK